MAERPVMFTESQCYELVLAHVRSALEKQEAMFFAKIQQHPTLLKTLARHEEDWMPDDEPRGRSPTPPRYTHHNGREQHDDEYPEDFPGIGAKGGPMARTPRYSAEQVIDALAEPVALVFLAAKRLGCTPETIGNYCRRYPSVQGGQRGPPGEMDTAELKLWESILKGESWGVTLCLKTLGKDRGYVERTEHTGEDGREFVIRVVYEAPPSSTNSHPSSEQSSVDGLPSSAGAR